MAELSERLREHREGLTGDFVAALEAQQFVTMMQAEHPEELEAWMHTRVIQFVTESLTHQERGQRARLVRGARFSRAFGDGDTTELSLFRLSWPINDEDVRRPLGQMRRPDLMFVAGHYERDGNQKMAMAAFMRALAKKAGARPVGEVMSEEKCSALLHSFVGPTALAQAA